jgi:hypothetical protein
VNYYIGIDPGKTGAVALNNANGENIHLEDFEDESKMARILGAWMKTYGRDGHIAVGLEELGAVNPKMRGSIGHYIFGRNVGIWIGILAALQIPFKIVKPNQWKKGVLFKTDSPDVKKQSLIAARRQWPEMSTTLLRREMDHNRADALWIADYMRRQG